MFLCIYLFFQTQLLLFIGNIWLGFSITALQVHTTCHTQPGHSNSGIVLASLEYFGSYSL